MNYDQALDGDHGTLAIAGDLDIYAAAELKERLVALCAEVRTLQLDLSATGLIDTAGLQVLLAAKRHLAAEGGALTITAASETCASVFTLLNAFADNDREVA